MHARPKCETLYSRHGGREIDSIDKNEIYFATYSPIIKQIIEYEAKIVQGGEFRRTIKEELVSVVWHPDKVEKIINTYGIDYLDTL